MHPSRDELSRFVFSTRAGQPADASVRAHVQLCEFCREYCDNLAEFLQEEERAYQSTISVDEMVSRLAQTPARIIPLSRLDDADYREQLLAADSGGANTLSARSILVSETQDLVLTIASDPAGQSAQLQITTAEASAAAFLLLEAPEIGRSFVTDANGRVEIERSILRDPARLKWQIRLPDAVFNLERISANPDLVRASAETELTTPQGDVVRVWLSDHPDGLSVAVRVVALHGRHDFKRARVMLTQPGLALIDEQTADGTSLFGALDSAQAISLRVFETL